METFIVEGPSFWLIEETFIMREEDVARRRGRSSRVIMKGARTFTANVVSRPEGVVVKVGEKTPALFINISRVEWSRLMAFARERQPEIDERSAV